MSPEHSGPGTCVRANLVCAPFDNQVPALGPYREVGPTWHQPPGSALLSKVGAEDYTWGVA